jgi:hypothetical protein
MRLGRNIGLVVALLIVVSGVGCKKRKPQIPAQSTAPTINKPTVAPVASQPQPTPPTVTAEPPQPSSSIPAVTTAKKPRVRHRKPTTTPPANTVTSADSNAAKPGVHKPGDNTASDSNVQISAEVPQPAANLRRQQTEGLLQSAEWNLKRINRTLNDGEDSMQRQVRNFITQSRLAMQDGDLERAYNLATKANLLSQELVK